MPAPLEASPHHHRDTHQEGHHGGHPSFPIHELLGPLPHSSHYRHQPGNENEHRSLLITNPFEQPSHHTAGSAEQMRTHEASREREASRLRDVAHERQLAQTEGRIEHHLRHNAHDFSPVYRELDYLKHRDGANIDRDLQHINHTMHERGLLTGQELIRDDRTHANGWGVVANDKQNKEHEGHRDGTMVSTSHAPQESAELHRHYSHMHHRRGHYNGWHQSVEGGGGAHGGFDGQAVGGHVPPGARRDLIEQALRLAGVPATPQNIDAINTIVTRESGWNPNITNHWDSNARAGNPSTGLMQTVQGTFNRYALHGMDNNIHDPLSNLVAGIRYIRARYGADGVERIASRPGGY